MHHDRLRVIDRDVSAAYCWSSSGDGANLLCKTVISALQTSRMIGGFWWILIACCVALLRASTLLGILISLSLLTSLGWSLRWMASFTLREYQLGSWSVNLTFSERGCTQSYFRTADVCFRESRISLSCYRSVCLVVVGSDEEVRSICLRVNSCGEAFC